MDVDEQSQLRMAMLAQWPTVEVPLRELENEISAWRPKLLLIDTYSVAVWGRKIGAARVALVWGWAAASFGGVAQTDPTAIETNALLLNDEGLPIRHLERTLRLNGVLHRLEWHKSLFDAEFIIRSAKEFVGALRLPS